MLCSMFCITDALGLPTYATCLGGCWTVRSGAKLQGWCVCDVTKERLRACDGMVCTEMFARGPRWLGLEAEGVVDDHDYGGWKPEGC